jgi:AraC family transcriptional activator of pyochelin receptor
MYSDINIVGFRAGKITLSQALPDLLRMSNAPGVKNLVARGPWGQLNIREIVGDTYAIWHNRYLLTHGDSLAFDGQKPMLRLWMSLQNSLHFSMEGLKQKVLHERSFNMSYNPLFQQSLRLQGGLPYSTVEIYFSKDHLLRLRSCFPGIEQFFCDIEQEIAGSFQSFNQVADREILDVMMSLLYSSFPPAIYWKYLDLKVAEILLLTMRKMVNNPLQKRRAPSEKIINSTYEAVRLIRKNINRLYTLHELEDLTGQSAYRLKKGFRAIYDLSVSNFMHETRMQKARLLLEETNLPITRIAADTGFTHPFAFSSAYKKYFGFSPSLAQKSRQH